MGYLIPHGLYFPCMFLWTHTLNTEQRIHINVCELDRSIVFITEKAIAKKMTSKVLHCYDKKLFAVTHHKWGKIGNTTLALIYAATLPINECSRGSYIFNVCDWLFIFVYYPADHCLPQRASDSSHNSWMAWSLRYDLSTSVSLAHAFSHSHTHTQATLSYSVGLLQ